MLRLEREEAEVAMRMLEAIEELKQVRRQLEPHELVIQKTAEEILKQPVRIQPPSNPNQ